MLLIKNRGFKKIYVYGGSGIFDAIASTASRLWEPAKQAVVQTFKKSATQAATQVGKKLGEKAVQKGKQAISKAVQKVTSKNPNKELTQKSLDILNKHLKTELAPKSRDILTKYSAPKEGEFNLNTLIDGGVVRIEDYIRRPHLKY